MGNSGFDVQADIRGPWRRYLDSLVAFRAELHRYCARLTGNIWDGEDLVQESLARVFSLLGKTDAEITQPRPYLFRTATHLWFDQQRRAQRELTADVHEAAEPASGEAEEYRGDDVRSAVAVLMETTSPQERASWILKELCDMSIADIASIVGTTPGAVKSALSRARQRLEGRMSAAHVDAPPRDVVEQFARAIENQDVDRLAALCSPNVTVELVGGAEMRSFEDSKTFFEHAHMVMPAIGFGADPRWQVIDYGGEPMVVGFRTLSGREGVNEVHRLECSAAKITRVRAYVWSVDVLKAIAEHLGTTAVERPVKYRSPSVEDFR